MDRLMEQIPQAGSASDATATPQTQRSSDDETLREELAKWRERVPRLAQALRQRAEEVAVLRAELERQRRVQPSQGDVPAGIRARDELIAELEARIADLSERCQHAEGELHKRALKLESLEQDVSVWKGKWQAATEAMDRQAAEASAGGERTRHLVEENEDLRRRLEDAVGARDANRQALEEAEAERDSLRRRNEQLFETTELANRQIGSLTDSLSELRAAAKENREREAETVTERDALAKALEESRSTLATLEAEAERQAAALAAAQKAEGEHQARAATLEARAGELQGELERTSAAAGLSERAVAALTEELHLLSTAVASGLQVHPVEGPRLAELETAREAAEERAAEAESRRAEAESRAASLATELTERHHELEELRRELARLGEVVERAQRTTDDREAERRALSERLQTFESRCQHLEEQLAERSELVVNLEQEQASATELGESLRRERDELKDALLRAERDARETAEHVKALDDKLERQKELMEDLEQELAEARDDRARAKKAERREPDAEAEVGRLQEQIRKLEVLVRERTEALNRLEWQHQLSADAGVEHGTPGEGQKLMVVLNQQLAAARERNEALLARIRELESAAGSVASGSKVGDDLTQIQGVGQKLAQQLNELGIYRYQQIAELDETALADETHVLHAHRGRILRDGWIEQAVSLISH